MRQDAVIQAGTLITKILSLPRATKKFMFLGADTVLVLIALYAAASLRYGTYNPLFLFEFSWHLFPVMAIVGPAVICFFGLPRIQLHAIESDAIVRVAVTAVVLSMSAICASYLLGLAGPRSVPLIFGIVFFMGSVSLRLFGLRALRYLGGREAKRLPVIIYGAGAAGIQLASALRQSAETRPILFVDDNANLQGVMIAGLQVFPASELRTLIMKRQAKRVLLAIPSLSTGRRTQLIAELSNLLVEVQVLPSFIDLMEGRGLETSLRPVSPDDLLGRNMVALNTPEIAKTYAGRVVMVTGAGGSIGSELCRQLVNCRPARIVLFEQSEFSLYAIEGDIECLAARFGIPVVARLGSVTNRARVKKVVTEEAVDIILHAAAYKHVPMVEKNEIEGAANNVIGTHIVADAARELDVERFILVSTDKAVRPTNIMGATKRIAERVVQELQTRGGRTRFAMVRFGNVLGSSGSVLPLFQKQIAAGGPVTVTHPDVTRFFMTIPEAARLVLLAGAYAEGGDVFVLDMGKPQKIIDLARRMIALSGRNVQDPVTGYGDIAIEITGLRPGEKLYEELLVGNTLCATPHPKILRAEEPPPSQIEVASLLRDIRKAITLDDPVMLRKIIELQVDGYHLPERATLSA